MTNLEKLTLEATIKVWTDFEQSTKIQYLEIIENKVGLLLELMNSLSVEKIEVSAWKIWSEPLIYKLCYHLSSLLKLYKGTPIPFLANDSQVVIFDEPSVIILFRVALENYLTFYFLYIDRVDEQEKEFRNLVWRYSGLTQRVGFKFDDKEARSKQKKELKTVQILKEQIESSSHFKMYSKKQKESIIGGRKARLFETWSSLIIKSSLRTDLFQNLYGYKSNYSHSEFISILQIQQGNYGYSEVDGKSRYLLFLIHGIVCKAIIELTVYFPTIGQVFSNKSETIQAEIIALRRFCCNETE